MKNVERALIATGVALVFSGGIASAAILSSSPTAQAAPLSPAQQLATQMAGSPTGLADLGGLHGTDFLNAAATYIGIPAADIQTQLAAGKTLSAIAVANGKTRDGLIAALVAVAQQSISTAVDQVGMPRGFGPGEGKRGDKGLRDLVGDSETAAATYLGVPATDLETKTDAGQSLAAIAAATPGKTRDGLIQALVADATAKIEAAKTAGTLTATQATQLESTLLARITAEVDKVETAGH